MLRDIDHIDEQPLVEALATYYYRNGNSFDGLVIEPGNHNVFNTVRDWAINYYDED
jgi:hypothetical protein